MAVLAFGLKAAQLTGVIPISKDDLVSRNLCVKFVSDGAISLVAEKMQVAVVVASLPAQ